MSRQIVGRWLIGGCAGGKQMSGWVGECMDGYMDR